MNPRAPRLIWIALVLLLVGLFAPRVNLPHETFDYVVFFDITQSMDVTDYEIDGLPTSRLDYARYAMRRALRQLPCGSRIGWGAFAEYRSLLLLAPVEVCSNYNDLLASLNDIDGRMRWANASEVGKGVYWSVRTAREEPSKPDVLFISDGHEAPPLNPNEPISMPDDVKPGQIRGWIIGAGGDTPQRIPRTDADGNRMGYWRANDVIQLLSPDGRSVAGAEHLSALREPHLKALAERVGFSYARLEGPDSIGMAMRDARYVRRAPAPVDLYWLPVGLAVLLLIVHFLPQYAAFRGGPSIAALAVFSLLSLPAAGQTSSRPAPETLPFKLKPLAPDVYAAIGGSKAGSNAGFVIGDDGVLVIDTFFYPEAATALLGEIRRITSKPLRYVINTHYHIDHVAGDAVFKAAGATIIAHRNVPGWIHSENVHLFGDGITPELRQRIEALTLPDRTIDSPMTLDLGKRRVEVRPIEGHTGGDLMVEIPDARVVFAGDILWNHITPTTIDGTISRWSASLVQLEASADTVFVPGHGEVASKKDIADLRRFFADLRRVTSNGLKAGLAGDALVAAEGPKFRALYSDWPYMDRAPAILIPQMEAELAGHKRVPVPAK